VAVPQDGTVPLTGNPLVDGLTQGSSWTFGGGARTLTYSLDLNFDGPTAPWTSSLISSVDNAFVRMAERRQRSIRADGQSQHHSAVRQHGRSYRLHFAAGQGFEQGFLGIGIFPDPSYADFLLEGVYTRDEYPRPEGDIQLENTSSELQPAATSPGGIGFAIILHEIGHALGLKHPGDDGGNSRPTFTELGIAGMNAMQYTVMSVVSQGGILSAGFPATPMPLDILAIQQIYGANMSYHAAGRHLRVRKLRAAPSGDLGCGRHRTR
jgi:serralysin